MKGFLIISSALLLFSCGESSNQVCDCAKAGENLDKYAKRFLTEIPTDANRDSISLLKSEREKICAEVKKLSTPELEKQRDACDAIKF